MLRVGWVGRGEPRAELRDQQILVHPLRRIAHVAVPAVARDSLEQMERSAFSRFALSDYGAFNITKPIQFNGRRSMPVYELEGVRPEIPEDSAYWIAPNAIVVGRVRVLQHSSLWFGAVLRGDNEWITIGERSNVQDNS